MLGAPRTLFLDMHCCTPDWRSRLPAGHFAGSAVDSAVSMSFEHAASPAYWVLIRLRNVSMQAEPDVVSVLCARAAGGGRRWQRRGTAAALPAQLSLLPLAKTTRVGHHAAISPSRPSMLPLTTKHA